MIFRATPLPGAFQIELEPHTDERGGFARTFCEYEFAAHGLATRFRQANLSWNDRAGTLRGLHWQAAPHGEAKLVRCTAGAVWDVIVDLRRDSPSCLRWYATELDARRRNALYVPPGFAHGFLTLADASEVSYWMSESHAPDAARGLRWDDPRLAIAWPARPRVMSERDRALPAFEESLLYGDPS
jgi:dTDP-4-dehydrorhamnose 3,5-epimerase